MKRIATSFVIATVAVFTLGCGGGGEEGMGEGMEMDEGAGMMESEMAGDSAMMGPDTAMMAPDTSGMMPMDEGMPDEMMPDTGDAPSGS